VKRGRLPYHLLILGIWSGLLLSACSQKSTAPAPSPLATQPQRASDVPDLPFPDNPDPNLCGIPVKWGKEDPAWLSGYYQGKLIEPIVYLYDSHLRNEITGEAPSGAAVRILLYQQNPKLDFYMVETIDLNPKQTGWVPAPFLSFQK
jgi:hypothetical protein